MTFCVNILLYVFYMPRSAWYSPRNFGVSCHLLDLFTDYSYLIIVEHVVSCVIFLLCDGSLMTCLSISFCVLLRVWVYVGLS